MNNVPLVSIIIPTFGGPDFLPRAISGVLKQNYNNWELIIVDDNGVDSEMQKKTQSVVEPFLVDPRIQYYCHEVNKNGSAARNTGVSKSKGEFIALLDDDDEYNPDFLEKQVAALNSLTDDYALVYCSHITYYEGAQIEVYNALQEGSLLFENLVHSVEIATTSILIRRQSYEAVRGFDESFKRHQDWEFLARIASQYLIKANDFIGYKRYLEWRNVPTNASKAKYYREHYLNKMQSYIEMLPRRQQRIVILNNKLEIALWYLKEKQYGEFLREYIEVAPGLYGIKFMLSRLLIVLSRRRFKLI